MIHLEFRFPGGRYHATPWGHHVNEGLVEWPPSPWRLVRAFIATAFTKLAVPDPVPVDHPLRRLVAALATQMPSFRAMSCPATHTRHYMPLGDKSGKTTLVLDACAVPGDSPLIVSWPVELDQECADLLHRIIESLGYLGRAESWVVGRVLPAAPDPATGALIEPHTPGTSKGPGWEQVSLLAPTSAAEYAQTFSHACHEAEDRFPAPDGKKKPGITIEKQRTQALAPYPPDLFACLTTDTAFLQQHGWSQPPGSRRVLYWRPTNALSVTPAGRTSALAKIAPVQAILLAFASDTRRRDVLPQFSRALPQAELLHRALVSRAAKGAFADISVFTGKGPSNQPLTGHRHIHYIPLNLERSEPGRLDHVLLWAPMGFDGAAQRTVLNWRQTWTKGGDKPLFVTVAGMGTLDDLRPVIGPRTLGPARVWISRTPFVPPRHVKRNGANTLENQARTELASRYPHLPEASVEIIAPEDSASLNLHRFIRVRRDPAKAPPQDRFVALRLTFANEFSGPLTLGYAAHFGLGLFVPGS